MYNATKYLRLSIHKRQSKSKATSIANQRKYIDEFVNETPTSKSLMNR